MIDTIRKWAHDNDKRIHQRGLIVFAPRDLVNHILLANTRRIGLTLILYFLMLVYTVVIGTMIRTMRQRRLNTTHNAILD